MDIVIDALAKFPELVGNFLNSKFAIAATGSFAGALGGAWGAHKIATRAKEKEALLEEIRNTNSAMMTAFDICNAYLTLKNQHVKSLKENFETKKEELEGYLKEEDKQEPFHFQADLQVISTFDVPITTLQKQAYDKLSLNGRPLALVSTLTRCIYSLHDSIRERNQWVSYLRQNSPVPNQVLALMYFGLPYGEGHIDETHPSLVKAICQYTDDCIMFSSKLAEDDLAKHGNDLYKKFEKKYGKGAPKVNKPDFSQARKNGLMPDEKDYADWFKAFKTEN